MQNTKGITEVYQTYRSIQALKAKKLSIEEISLLLGIPSKTVRELADMRMAKRKRGRPRKRNTTLRAYWRKMKNRELAKKRREQEAIA